MQIWIINIVLGTVFGAVLAGIMIPKILLIAFRKKLFDEPNERKIHSVPVPRLGGLAFTPVLFFTIAFLAGVNIYFGFHEIQQALTTCVMQLAFSLCSLMMLYIIGIADDLIGVRYRAKFIAQILCGIMLVGSSLWIYNLNGFCGIHNLNIYVGGTLAVIVMVFIINAINLIDGVDGLASGLSAVAFLYYAIVFFQLENYVYALVASIMLGILVPFFIYNVFGKSEKSQKIFMGDTGSLTIGILLAIMSIKVTTIPSIYVFGLTDNLVIAFAPLMIPCFDVLRVFAGRIRKGHNPFLPDKSHIHHKILALGVSPHKTMIFIVAASFVLTVINVLLTHLVNTHILFIGDVLIYFGFCTFLDYKSRKRAANNSETRE